MCELFAMSSALPTEVNLSLNELRRHGCQTDHHCDGWGLAYYHGLNAEIYKEPAAAAFSEKLNRILGTKHASQYAIAHIRKATQGGRTFFNTQPFNYSLNGQSLVFAHNGNLKDIHQLFELERIFPLGETDSEFAFCYLLEKLIPLYENGLPDVARRRDIILATFLEFAKLGPANFLFSDGDCLFAFANRRIQLDGEIKPPGMHYLVRECELNTSQVNADDPDKQLTGITLSHPHQKLVLIASVPLSKEQWIPFAENELLVLKNGERVPST